MKLKHPPVILKYTIVDSVKKLRKLTKKMESIEEFAFDTETNTLRVVGDNENFLCVGISISWGFFDNYYIPLHHRRHEDYKRNLPESMVRKHLKKVFEREDVRIIGHNLKFDMHVLARLGIIIKTKDLFDDMIASWLCDENTPNGLKENTSDIWGFAQAHFREVTDFVPNEVKKEFGYKSNQKVTFDLVLIDQGAPYALNDAFYTWFNYLYWLDKLEEEKMDKIYCRYHVNFLRTLFHMEERGVTVDIERLNEMKSEIEKDTDRLMYEMQDIAGVEFNANSSQMLGELIFGYVPDKKLEKDPDYTSPLLENSFGLRAISKTNSGAPQTNANTLLKLSKMNYKSKRKQQGVEFCKKLLEYKKLAKLKSAFIDGMLEQVYSDGKAHPNFNIIGTDSGRISCIEENQLIKCVGEDKPIKDMKVGDLVYCYDEQGNVHIRKVLSVIDKGIRPCVSVTYRSQGTHTSGSLICTPDHKILTAKCGWVKASDLSYGCRVAHLRRSTEARPRIYGMNNFCKQEQIFIKNEVFNDYDPNNIIHHKDLNKSNNKISNLRVMSRAEHTSLHSKLMLEEGKLDTYTFCHTKHEPLRGEQCPNYKKVSAEYLEHLVREYEGRISKIPMDFATFKKKCEEVGFNYRAVAGEYQTQYREVDDETFIKTFYECKGVPYAISRKLNIGRTKVSNTIKRLDLCINHTVLGVEYLDECRHVYDLEVEEFHNFIASEVCVHNCSSPNLQQLPKADEEDKYQIRSLFIGSEYLEDDTSGEYVCDLKDAKEGDFEHCTVKRKKIVAGDFSNLEMRVLAHFSEDKNLLEMFANDSDTHGSTAVNMFELDCKPEEVKKKYPHLRQAAKVINFLLMYGGGAFTLYNNLKDDPWNPIDLGDKSYTELYGVKTGEEVAQIYIDKYFSTYSGVADFIKQQKRFAHKYGYVNTLLRRKRRLPDIRSRDFKQVAYCERLAVNSAVQGSAADITGSAQNLVDADPWYEEHGVLMMIQIHDELVFECPEPYVEECIRRTKAYMEHPFGPKVELNLKMRADFDSGDSYQEAK